MRLIFKPKNYINGSIKRQHHSVSNRCCKKTSSSPSTLTHSNILYLKSLGYNVRRITVIPGSSI